MGFRIPIPDFYALFESVLHIAQDGIDVGLSGIKYGREKSTLSQPLEITFLIGSCVPQVCPLDKKKRGISTEV